MSKAIGRRPGDEGRTTNGQSRAWFFVLRPSSLALNWRGDTLPALAAGLLAMLLLALAYTRAWPLAVDIGTRDERFVGGFNATEDFGGRLVRWTSGDATVALPRPPDGRPALLSVTLLNSRPDGSPAPHVTLSADGRTLAVLDVSRTPGASGVQTYHVPLPGGIRFDWATRIRLQSDTITLPNDLRPLGVVVDRVALEPTGGLPWPSLWLLCWGLLLGGLCYGFARSIGLSRALAWVLVALVAAPLAIGVALRPLETLPFIQRVALLPAVGCLGIWLARWLAPPVAAATDARRKTKVDAPARRMALSFVRGADLPIYLATLWWMGPLWQWVETADGAVNVTPAPTTSWIGGALALGLLALAGWYALRGRALPPEPRASTLRNAALGLFVAAALAHLAYMIWFAFQRQGPDFWILFKGARDWARGGSFYDLDAIIENHFGHVFKVPPFYGMLFVPFVFQDGDRILLFHRILNVILLSTTALIWFRMWGLRLVSAAGAGVLILLNFRPITDTIAFGQIDLALLLALTLALWALRSDRAALDVLAGALVALGTLFKVYPLLLLAFFVAKRRWWAVAGFGLGMLVLNGISIAVIGWEMHRIYLFEVLPRIGGTTSWVENQTISGFLARLALPPTDTTIFHNRPLELLGLALGGVVGLLACILALRPARSTSTSFAMQYGAFGLVMVLTVPAAWMHYETLLFLPFAALLLHARDRQVRLSRAALLAISFALAGYGNQWSYYDGTVLGELTVLGVSYKFYGMLLLAGVLAATLLEGWAPSWRDLAQFYDPRRHTNTHEGTANV